MTEQQESLGQRLKRLRLSRGLSQGKLSHRADVPLDSIYKWEKGRRAGMRQDTLERLAAALGVSPSYLLFGQDAPPSDGWPSIEEVLRNTTVLSDGDISVVNQVVEGLVARRLMDHEVEQLEVGPRAAYHPAQDERET